MKAVVLAAGKSTRISSISNGMPKPLLKIGATSIIERNLHWLKKNGINEVWINLHHRPEEIKRHLHDIKDIGLAVNYSYEEKILGTAGAVKKLQRELKDDFLVVYGDNLFNFDLKSLINTHNSDEVIATIALFSFSQHLNSGIASGRVRLVNSKIVDFVEHNNALDLVNAGCYVCSPEICNYIPKDRFFDFAEDLFPQLLSRKITLRGYVIEGYCLGLDDPASYAIAKKLVEEKEIV